MAAKDALKHWVTLIDHALHKEKKEHRPKHAPAPPAQEDPRPARREAAPPLALPTTPLTRDMHIDETDTATLRSAIQALRDHTSKPIDIYADIYALIAPTDIQITSPRDIEPALLQPFETGAKDVMLIFLTGKKLIHATIHTMYHTHMLVDMDQSSLSHRLRERLLVLFPALPGKRYVLQAVVSEIYAGRLKLRYQDPRYDMRRQFSLPTPILLRLVHPATVSAMAQKHLRLVRETYLSPPVLLPTARGCIADRLYQSDTGLVSPHMRALEDTTPIVCGLYDISPGGVCLTCPEEHRPDELLQRVARLHIPLAPLSQHTSHEQYFPFVLEPFGVIRDVKTTSPPWLLHLRFLKRLPRECDVLFAYVAQHYATQPTPQE
jgi:hypothetical protein